MDYDKLIEHLRECGTYGFKQEECRDAALAIKALRADLARMTAERDAAVERLREWEKFDIYLLAHNFLIPEKWRGIQKED